MARLRSTSWWLRIGLVSLILLGSGIVYSGILYRSASAPAMTPRTAADNNAAWERLLNQPLPLPVWVCPTHPQHSWGTTVGSSYIGLDVFTEHSVLWFGGRDLRIPYVLTPERLWTGLVMVTTTVVALLAYGVFRTRWDVASRTHRGAESDIDPQGA